MVLDIVMKYFIIIDIWRFLFCEEEELGIEIGFLEYVYEDWYELIFWVGYYL